MINNNAENLRLYYLQSMGISSYYPRFILPGALVSTACDWAPEETEGNVAVRAQVKPAQVQPAVPHSVAEPEHHKRATLIPPDAEISVGHRSISGRLAEEDVAQQGADHAEPGKVSKSETVAIQETEAQAEAVRLQLLLMPVDGDLAVLSQIPVLSHGHMQERQHVLLQNILRWLGKHENAAMPVRHFQWPLPGMALSNTRQQAGLGLMRFLEQAFVEHSFRYLLVLGEQAAQCLSAGASQTEASVPWQMLVTCSIDEMLAMPQLKREAWKTLLPLHAALQP